MVFMVERRTTKFLPTKQYHIVLGCGLVYCDHENFSTNWPKIHCSRKFYPPEITRYTVFRTAHAGHMFVRVCKCILVLKAKDIYMYLVFQPLL